LLGVDVISPSDNFFNLGGHSLMGTMMIARIRELLGITLSLRDIFEAQTPERLAQLVGVAGEKNFSGHDQQSLAKDEEREVFEI
jgi:phthiocerol/phenolphthiocerol synthesis type-I polyketide synthase E